MFFIKPNFQATLKAETKKGHLFFICGGSQVFIFSLMVRVRDHKEVGDRWNKQIFSK